jgi:hypothetical protein
MIRRVLGLVLVMFVCAFQSAYGRTHDELVPSYAPLRPVIKPSQLRISPYIGPGHVEVKFRRGADVETRNAKLAGGSAERVLAVFRDNGLADPSPLFTDDPATIRARRMKAEDRVRMNLPDLSLYYRSSVTNPAAAEEVIQSLNALDEVEIAYFVPKPEVASITTPATPDWESLEDYLEIAPGGVDAYAAWTLPGGVGSQAQIIDIEYGWQLTHEDLSAGATAVVIGVINTGDTDHGTAVMGEMLADDNGFGMTGIVPQADFGVSSVQTMSVANALYQGANASDPGDLMLIELHAPGPHYNFQVREDQLGYVPMEYWQSNFDAIVYAYANGVIVCEAAGNGAEYLDGEIYDSVFNRDFRNSHAILCGAGYPPSFGSLDRSRLGFSNYGSRVDLQGYGTAVYSTGYGDLYSGGSQDSWYTSSFGGTSSASPIVTGSAAAVSSVFQEMLGTVVDADSIRNLLVATGSPQQAPQVTQHIGPRPDLRAALALIFDPVDSIWYSDIELHPGESATLPIELSNSHAVSDIYLPFKLTGPATIYIDSITLGPRTASFESIDLVYDNRYNGEIGYALRSGAGGETPPMPAGKGVVANLWVRAHFLANPGQVEVVDSAWLGSTTRLRLVSYFDDGYPDYFESGSITITPSCDCPYQGDFDEDMFVTPLDLAAVIDILFASGVDPQDPDCPDTRADMDCDGFATSLDLSVIIDYLFASGPGPCDPCL